MNAPFEFPRFAVLVIGESILRSDCCRGPLHIFFDVVDGLTMTCSNMECPMQKLHQSTLPDTVRSQLWGCWTRFSGGALPAQARSRESESSLRLHNLHTNQGRHLPLFLGPIGGVLKVSHSSQDSSTLNPPTGSIEYPH